MSNVREVRGNDFDKVVLQADKPVLVDFWAPWCGPCKTLGPVVEQLAEDYSGRALVAKVNVDEAKEMRERFGFRSIPTLLFFQDGEVRHRITGVQPIGPLKEVFDSMLGNSDPEIASQVVAGAELARALTSRGDEELDDVLRGNPGLVSEAVEVNGMNVLPAPFLLASSDFEKLKVLLKHGAGIRACDLDSARDIKNKLDFVDALFGSKSVHELTRLIEAHPQFADDTITVRGQKGRPLTFLLISGNREKAEVLAEYAKEITLIELAGLGRLAELKSRLDDNPVALIETDEEGLTALAMAARNGHLDVGSWILEAGTSAERSFETNDTVSPMGCAIAGGHVEFLDLLLSHGEPISFAESGGVQELVMAIIGNDMPLVKWLLTHGVNPAVPLPNGKTPAQIAEERGAGEIGTLLADASA